MMSWSYPDKLTSLLDAFLGTFSQLPRLENRQDHSRDHKESPEAVTWGSYKLDNEGLFENPIYNYWGPPCSKSEEPQT